MARNALIRHWRLFSLIFVLAFVFWLVYTLRSALFPFVLGLVLAYVFMPAIRWAENRLPPRGRRRHLKRVSLILAVFLVVAGSIGLLAYFIVTAIVQSWTLLLHNAPAVASTAFLQLNGVISSVRDFLPADIQETIDQIAQDAGGAIGRAARDALSRGISSLSGSSGAILGLGALPMFLFFVLKDWEKLGRAFYSALPASMSHHTRNIVGIFESVLLGYVRAQVLLGLVVGSMVLTGLLILQVEFAAVLAVFAAATEAIPTIGPLLAATVAGLVTLATAPEKVFWVVAVFGIVQLLENQLLEPKVQAGFMHVHPAAAIVLLVVGSYIGGLWGMMLAIPLTSTAVALFRYVREQVDARYRTPQPDAPVTEAYDPPPE